MYVYLSSITLYFDICNKWTEKYTLFIQLVIFNFYFHMNGFDIADFIIKYHKSSQIPMISFTLQFSPVIPIFVHNQGLKHFDLEIRHTLHICISCVRHDPLTRHFFSRQNKSSRSPQRSEIAINEFMSTECANDYVQEIIKYLSLITMTKMNWDLKKNTSYTICTGNLHRFNCNVLETSIFVNNWQWVIATCPVFYWSTIKWFDSVLSDWEARTFIWKWNNWVRSRMWKSSKGTILCCYFLASFQKCPRAADNQN